MSRSISSLCFYGLVTIFLVEILPIVALPAVEPVSVEAIGKSVVISGDKMAARSRATRDAYRNAIEKVCGVNIGSLTTTRGLQLLCNVVLTQASGYLSSRTIIDEGVGADGFYFVKMQAEVVKGDIHDRKDALPLFLEIINNPHVGVLFAIDKPAERPLASIAESELTKQMVAAGYHCVALRPYIKFSKTKAQGFKMLFEGNSDDVRRVAKDANVDLLVMGQLNPTTTLPGKRKDSVMGALCAVTMDVDLRIIIAQTRQVIRVENPRVKSGVSSSVASARTLAARKAGSIIARKLIWSLPQMLIQNGRTYEFRISNCGFNTFRKLESVLSLLESVESVNARPWKHRTATFDVRVGYLGLGTTDLAQLLLDNKTVPVKLVSVDSATIVAKVRPKLKPQPKSNNSQ